MQDFKDKKIVLGITGSIAAYKSTYLIRELIGLGAKVKVIMTKSAKEFVSPLTIQALSGEVVRSESFDSDDEKAMSHIELARWADFLLIAPSTANFLAKMAHGIADDLLSTIYLVTKAPTIICPAMNKCMWEHPATQDNCKTLLSRKVMIIGPDHGAQACGEFGQGRLSEYYQIVNSLRLYHINHLLLGRNVLITAGPTQEDIDPARFLTNRSSGKMGYALAQAAYIAGANVTLISGPTKINIPEGIKFISVTSAKEMLESVLENLQTNMIFIGSAAVADYRLENPSNKKLKKDDSDTLVLTLTKNPDIIKEVAATQKALYTIGFAAETNNLIENATKKLHVKGIDMIVANEVGKNLGFDSDNNKVVLLTHNSKIELNLNHKINIAGEIIINLARIINE
jgi:phosphopantothenoylcysteine decarboxylase / phosphopantothenate---cysteine ligase